MMRGLTLFITDIRRCTSKEDEIKQINKELANIRNKFKGDKPLKGYDKRKYICKLIFMFLLGHKFDFGYIEAVDLLSSNAYREKQIGYLFISVVMQDDHDFMPLIINAIKNDLSSSNSIFQNLALQFVSNNANREMSECLGSQVLELLASSNSADFVKQTAALTLLQLLRNKPDLINSKQLANRTIHLLSSHNLGIVTASASLLEFLTSKFPSQYELCLSHVITRLSRIISSAVVEFQEYTYCNVSSPWLTVKLLRILKNFPAPTDESLKNRLRVSLEICLSLNKAQEPIKSKRFEHNNTKYMIIFESISLIIHMDIDRSLLSMATSILGSAINQKEPNMRLMALEMMLLLANRQNSFKEVANMYFKTILKALKSETDITIKKSAINLLYNICDKSNIKQIIEEVLYFLQHEDESAWEEVVLKTAALAGLFDTDLEFYVDTLFNLLQVCADDISENIWYTLIKVIIDNDSIQEYAARTAYAILHQSPCHDSLVKATGYIMGEFGYLIAKDPSCGYLMQLNLLKKKYHTCSPPTRAVLLTTYMKFLNLYPELRHEIQSILREKCNMKSENEEIQKRAVEYLRLSQIASRNLLATVLDEMPSCKRQQSAVAVELEKRSQIMFNTSNLKTKRTKRSMLSRSVSDVRNIPENIRGERLPVAKSVSHSNLPLESTNLDLLTELFRDIPISSHNNVSSTLPKSPILLSRVVSTPSNEAFLNNLLFSEVGTLFEDNIVNVFIECEFRRHFGRFHLTYTNKSNSVLSNFTVEGNFHRLENKCSIWFKPTVSVLNVAQSVEQDIHLECLNEFGEKPSLTLRFNIENNHREIKLILPLTVNKFMEPSTMLPDIFIKRWQNLANPLMELSREITAKYSMIYGVTRQKIKGFRLSVIENVEQNSENFYCTGIFYAREFRVGMMIKLERYPEANKYRLTIRSSQRSLSQNISNLLFEML